MRITFPMPETTSSSPKSGSEPQEEAPVWRIRRVYRQGILYVKPPEITDNEIQFEIETPEGDSPHDKEQRTEDTPSGHQPPR